ncbi:MAG: DNA-processing protein DprA [Cyclobacteriaceae bacterium]
MSQELVHQLALELIPGIGNKGVKQLISYCGSASSVFTVPKSKLLKVPGVGNHLANTIKSSDFIREAESIIESVEKIDARIVHFTDSEYPKRLRMVYDAPNLLYIKGNGTLNTERSVAVVGTRKATNYGKKITDKIVADLGATGATIISGLAYGIDIQAHKTSLKNHIPTHAVIAGGLDRIYPSVHKKYANDIQDEGLIISESVPGAKPDAHLFPSRNRIIAGLSDVTIVVEAAERGGALITATLADSYNRPVFAVPGDVGNTYSSGTNKLISTQKALIYTGIEDLIYHLGWDDQNKDEIHKKLPELSYQEKAVYTLLKDTNRSLEIDTISLLSQIPVNHVASVLLELEFKDLVKSLPGKKYEATL